MPSNKWSTGWFPKTKTKERNGKGARVVTRNNGPIFRKSLLRKPLHCVCFVVADLLYMRISPLGMLLVGLWHDYHYCFRGEKERKSLWERRCSFGERQNMFGQGKEIFVSRSRQIFLNKKKNFLVWGGNIFWEEDKILLSKERKSLWERRGNRKMGNRVLSAKLCTQVS